MKRMIWAVAALLGFVAWADFNTALDCNGLTFTTGGDADWFEQTDDVKVGESALRSGKITHSKNTWLETTVSGAGMLSFWWKADSEWVSCDFLDVFVDGNLIATIGGSDLDWVQKRVVVTGEGLHTIRWTYQKDGSVSEGSDCGWLDGVEWMPAPEKIRVTLETNGGSALDPQDVTPGTTYGELPVPEWSGEGSYEFGGWYLDEELTDKAANGDPVMFRDHALYAKWRIPVSVLDTDVMKFGTDDGGDGYLPWEVVEDAEATGGYVLRSPVNQNGGYVWANVNGSGTLTFKWKLDGDSYCRYCGYNNFSMKVDDESGDPLQSYGWRVGKWQECSVALYGDVEFEHNVQWYSGSDSIALCLKDFVWTPAPEKMTVTFDANGGTVAAESREYVPGDTYDYDGEEALPKPTRKNYTFLGWCEDGVLGVKVADGDKVPLREAVKLVAKWGVAVSALNTKQLTAFKSTGADSWYAVDMPDVGKVAEVEPKGKWGMVYGKCGPAEGLVPTSSTLQMTTVSAGYLAFSWSLKNGGLPASGYTSNPVVAFTIYLDGKEIDGANLWEPLAETGVRQTYIYIPAGKHTLKWAVKGNPAYHKYEKGGYWDDDDEWVSGEEIVEYGSAPVARVWGFEFEPAGPQPDLQTWGGKLKTYKSWRTGDLAKFAAQFKTRMIADPEDYEARILFAVTRLGVLAENKQFADYAKTFGLTVDWARLSVTPPTPKFDKKTAAVNAMVDKTIALATPAISEARAALAGIPEDWNGTVTFDADEWPIDETVAIDVADVQFSLAGLDAALAGLNFLGAYDLTVNWPKVNDTVKLVTKIPVVKAVPKVGDTEGWEKNARCFRTVVEEGDDEEASVGAGAMAVNGTTLSLRLGYDFGDGFLNDTNQIHDFEFCLKSGDRKLNIYGELYGENGMVKKTKCYYDDEYGMVCPAPERNTIMRNYVTQTNVYCVAYDYASEQEWIVPATIELREGALVLNVNLAKVNLGTKKKPVKFSAKSWSVASGEIGVAVWQKDSSYFFEEYPEDWYDEDSGSWVYPQWNEETWSWDNLSPEDDPADYQPQYEYYAKRTGSIEWSQQSDSERKLMKFVNDQTALFSKVRDASRLGASRRLFKAALERALVADGKATARPAAQEGDPLHFFEYDPEMAEKIAFARNNTQRALAALDATNSVNFAEIAAEYDSAGFSTNKLMLADFDYTLLPNDEGMTRIYLGALFEGKITRAMLPPMRTNVYGEIVPDFDAMQDPTIGGLIPDMTHEHIAAMTGRFEETRELDHGAPEDVESWTKPGETLDYSAYKGYDVSGLPKGWTWNKKTGVLTPTTSGTFTLTFKKGKTTKQETVQIGPKPSVLLFTDNDAAVAVTGTGLYNVGATVKAVAAVQNGYAFGGWYGEDGELVSPLAVYSFKMTREDVSLLATTIPLENDFLDAKTDDEPHALAVGEECDLTPFHVYSLSPFSISAAGLPNGMTTEYAMEANDERFEGDLHIKGAPTVAGVYYVTLVAKNNGGYKKTHVVKLIVGEAEENETNTAGINWDSYADGEGVADNAWDGMRTGVRFEAILDVPNSSAGSAPKSAVATKTVKKKSTSTLPPGLSATFKDGRITLSGVPSAPGKFTMEFTVTYQNKKTAKAVKTVVVKDSGSVYIPTGVLDNDPNGAVRGTAAYVGVKEYGQVVKFTATTKDKKKWFFGGWYLDEACTVPADEALPGIDYRASTVSEQVGEMWTPGKGMYARFVTKAEEAEEEPAVVCDDIWRVYDEETGAATSLPVAIDSATKPTLTAKGLPAGTKLSGMNLVVSKPAALVPGWYNVTLTAKTAAGNTVTKKVEVLVPNVTTAKDMGLIEGLYTGDEGYTSMVRSFMKAGVKQTFTLDDLGVTVSNGWTLAVTGLPKGWTYNAKTGEFSGVATKVGKTTVTFTVSRTVSKKKTESYKATATFDLDPLPAWATGAFVGMAGDAYVRMDVAANGTISGYRQDAAGKKTFTATGFTTDDEGALSTTLKGKGVSLAVLIHPIDNLGVQQGVAEFDVGVAFNSLWGIEGAEPLPVFAENASCDVPAGNGTLTLKFGAKGVVTCTYKVGKNSTSGSTQICMVEWSSDDRHGSPRCLLPLP